MTPRPPRDSASKKNGRLPRRGPRRRRLGEVCRCAARRATRAPPRTPLAPRARPRVPVDRARARAPLPGHDAARRGILPHPRVLADPARLLTAAFDASATRRRRVERRPTTSSSGNSTPTPPRQLELAQHLRRADELRLLAHDREHPPEPAHVAPVVRRPPRAARTLGAARARRGDPRRVGQGLPHRRGRRDSETTEKLTDAPGS